MQASSTRLPLSAHVAYAFVAILGIGAFLNLTGGILAPLAGSLLISLLMVPMVRRLENRRMPRTFAILICLAVLIIVLAGIVFFFSYQVIGFQEQLPMLKTRANELFAELQAWLETRMKIRADEQIEYLNKAADNVLGSSSSLLGSVTGFFGDFFTVLGIMPVYIFFILYYRNFFENFICQLFPKEEPAKVHTVLDQIETVSQSYIIGLLTVVLIVGTLNTIGLMLLGIENAIFFGALGSLLAIIPYIGIIIGSLLPATIALVTKDSAWYAVGVVAVMMFVQFLEGNFITPKIVGGRVSVNPFIAILALFLGGYLWGAAGMVLAIPYTAILKVLCDNVTPLKPYGYLIGEPRDEDVEGPEPNPITKAAERSVRKSQSARERHMEEKKNAFEVEKTDLKKPREHGKKAS